MAKPVPKTVARIALVTHANRLIAALPTPEERRAVATLLDSVLLSGDGRHYAGFSYLPSELIEDGAALRPDYDDTRRRYH